VFPVRYGLYTEGIFVFRRVLTIESGYFQKENQLDPVAET
jgi:hypothetical protein